MSATTETPTKESLFTPIKEVAKRKGLKILAWGEYGVGKTFLGLSFPEPIYVISTEFGAAQLEKHFPGKKIFIMECSEAYTDKPTNQKGETLDQPFAVDPIVSLEKIEMATLALKDVTEGTIIVDSVTDIWAWIGNWLKFHAKLNVSKSGNEYMMRTEWQDANAKYDWLMRRLMSRPCHVVLTSRSAPVYDSQGNITATMKASTQKNTAYHADVVLHLQKQMVPVLGTNNVPTGQFIAKRVAMFDKCRFAAMDNVIVEDPTFDKLKVALKDKAPDGLL